MAKEIAKLLRTEMAADVTALPMLAKLLQAYGRKGDKVLAHITPEEAQRLEDEGGSGTINPHTGLPEYYDGEGGFDYTPMSEDIPGQEMSAADIQQATGVQMPQQEYFPGTEFFPTGAPGELSDIPASISRGLTPVGGAPVTEAAAVPASILSPYGTTPEALRSQAQDITAAATEGAPQEKGFFDDLTKGMTPQEKRNLLLRAGLGVGTGLLGALQGQRAARQAQQAKQEIADIGKPYREKGAELQAAALRGELTPAGQQQLQAAQAQLAQGIERRGGVGAMQAATQLQAFRQNLLDQQYNYGLKVAQIGDSYAVNAIRTGLTQDANVATSMRALGGALAGFYGSQPNA